MPRNLVTNTTVVQVTVLDTNGYSKTYNLDDPINNLTLNQIKEAFQPAIDGGWLYPRGTYPIASVKQANYSQAIKTSIDGETITIAPTSISFNFSTASDGGSQGSETVVVSGANPTAASVVDIISTTGSFDSLSYFAVTITDNNIVVNLMKKQGTATSSGGGTATLRVVVENRIFNIPITIDSIS